MGGGVLGVLTRGFAPQFHVNGRQTFLAAIRWEDDWPVFDEGHYRVPPADTTFIDDFDDGTLRPQWISRAGDPLAFAALGAEGLTLRSPGEEPAASTKASRCSRRATSRGRPRRSSGWRREAEILWLDSWHWARVGFYPDAVRVEVALGDIRQTLAEVRPKRAARSRWRSGRRGPG